MDSDIFSNGSSFDFFPKDDSSPGVLLIHGFTGTPAEVRYLGEGLAQRGVGAHAPLLAGHGTRVEDLARTSWRDWFRCVDEKVRDLEKVYRPESFYIGGLSMGALLAVHAYAMNPGTFAGLIVMAVPFRLPLTVAWAISGFRYMPVSFDIRIPKLGGPDVMDEKVRDLIPSYRHHSLKAAVSLQELSRRVREEDLPVIEGNVLLLHGKFDITAPLFNMELFREEARRARVKSKILPRSGHLIPVDVDRDVVCESVLDFIRLESAFP
jgi:carboxylesterase